MKLMLMDVIEYTTSDGPGFRTSIYSSGCSHQCKNCQNPQTWNLAAGNPVEVDDLLKMVMNFEFADVTFSGGDPFFQVEAFTELAQKIKANSSKNIWCYTGYTFEQIVANKHLSMMLPHIDVLVDGRFIEELKDPDLLFRGSSNQRLIDVQASIKKGETVLLDYNPFNLKTQAKHASSALQFQHV
ncbi:MAG: anaerobic ribonucleoside-triphosphate reductase activating protein [Salinivirgaceae bacterium]|nr:anaerobic ribonucleoside-triphosphate reductase activating protein [Salinivirgaceae bacterium]